jgi:PKD repeat protein
LLRLPGWTLGRILSGACLVLALPAEMPDAIAMAGDTVLIQFDSAMKYLSNGSDPGIGSAWTDAAFDDGPWSSGLYGVGYEAAPPGAQALIRTTVPPATSSVYTRARFTITDLSSVRNLFLGADYDDGYAAWINGVEVFRSPELPSGPLAWNTSASLHESSNGAAPAYGALHDISVAGLTALRVGDNVLAVGVWNSVLPSSDLVVVPRLSMNVPPFVTRGPYLQLPTPTSIVVRWRTSEATDGQVRYGAAPGALVSAANDAAVTRDHVVTLTGLQPDTKYYYSVGSVGEVLAGGDPGHFFHTSPPAGSAAPTRVWVIGDSGTADAGARAVRDAYAAFNGNARTNLWLMLGDNAYPDGTDDQYEAAVFDMYPEMLRTSAVFPTLGNHDGITADSATQSGPYYDLFTLPTGGEAGGLPSGTEAYYSFDYANIHFVCLESHETNRSSSGAMMTWLAQDLLSTSQDWIVAYWHHPPYSKGSHDSDGDLQLREMRENALPILESAGVDLVLTGHSHSYERSFLLDGHYGLSDTLTAGMVKDAGDGRMNGDGAYLKPSPEPAPHEGTVYVVAGSSGTTGGGLLNHPAMYLSLDVLGSLVLDVSGQQLDARFLDSSGSWRDYFTLYKGPGTPPVASFTGSPTSGTAPLLVAFNDQSANGPTAWAWDFDGGGTDSGAQNPSHLYATVGLYTVRLTAYNAPGSDEEVKEDYICVRSADGLGDADADGRADGADNCACAANPGQEDADRDGAGNACDADDDGDGVPDASDCGPLDPAVSASPGEIGATVRLGPAPGEITWVQVPQGTLSNVYRGSRGRTVPFAYNHTCFEAGSPDTVSTDPQPPSIGELLYYLVSAVNVCGEGSLGSDPQGSPLPNPSPCLSF